MKEKSQKERNRKGPKTLVLRLCHAILDLCLDPHHNLQKCTLCYEMWRRCTEFEASVTELFAKRCHKCMNVFV